MTEALEASMGLVYLVGITLGLVLMAVIIRELLR